VIRDRALLTARPLLLIATLASIAASWWHLAGWMARFEVADQWWAAALAATAVDIGLLAALRTVGEQSGRGRHEGSRDAKLAVALLVSISFAANVQHSLSVQPGDLLNAVAVSGVLPVVAIVMSHLYDVVNRQARQAARPACSARRPSFWRSRPRSSSRRRRTPSTCARPRL